MTDTHELSNIVIKINEEIRYKIESNLQNMPNRSVEFTDSIVDSIFTHHLILITDGQNTQVTYSGIVIWDNVVDYGVLDIEDYIRLRLDFIINVVYNMDFLNVDVLFCKDEYSKEFYLN